MKEEGKFKKSLNLFDSTAITVGSMIGSGIFIVSADIARNVGSPGWLLAVWVITGFMTVMAASSFGELASLFPHAGGVYVYLRESYSPLFGFLYGWTLFLVIQCGTIAAVGMAFAKYSGVLIPWISERNVIFSINSFNFNTTQALSIALILFLTWINSKGIEKGKRIQNLFTSSKVIIMMVFILLGLIGVRGMLGNFSFNDFWSASRVEGNTQVPLSGLPVIIAIGVSMVGSLFASDSWNNITFNSDEVINPRKTIPRSLILGTLIVSFIYFLMNLVYIMALPVKGSPDGVSVLERGIQFASEDRVATAVMFRIFGQTAEILMAVVVIISTFGCNNGIILSGARVYYAMAKDGLFFKRTGVLNKKGVPGFSLGIQAIWCILLCLSGTYSQLLDYVIFAALLFYILTILAIFILRKKYPDMERPYKARAFPAFLYIAVCLCIIVVLLIYKPLFTWPGLIIVLAGVPVYFLWKWISGVKTLKNQE